MVVYLVIFFFILVFLVFENFDNLKNMFGSDFILLW